MADSKTPIRDVSDTAFWVASFRAEESKRSDALFQDPLASVLIGDRGDQIAMEMFGEKYVRWTVVTRTVVIDRFIEKLIAEGVDTILNLGAGLDCRPYRMKLPHKLKWIEVDYDHIIKLKESKLSRMAPQCQLERISMDLSKRSERLKLLSRINSQSQKVLVLTEGVIPYLSEQSVAELAEDLRAQKNFRFWICEYLAPRVYPYLKNKSRQKQLRNAPFQFFPADWYGFFDQCGWKPVTTSYLGEASEKLGRPMPGPWWLYLLRFIMPAVARREMGKASGYILFTPK